MLDKAFQRMGLAANRIVIVSDIGCSGLFDTLFHTHALHGLHGRALTYATGLKMVRPELHVVVIMGDGGQGIGGAHLLAACRRNLNLTLLVLNNFNYGMTGGQFSATTPPEAQVGSGFLNRLERPLDICQVARAAGAPYVTRCSAYRKDLVEEIQRAIEYDGFAVMDIWGICPGRYTRNNRLTAKIIDAALAELPALEGVAPENVREEYSRHYRKLAASQQPAPPPLTVETRFDPLHAGRQEVILLGSAGQRIITAGEILCVAGLSAGLKVTQKNEYNITVLRGLSISEVILSQENIDFTGVEQPTVIIALGQEGVNRRQYLFECLQSNSIVLQLDGVNIPLCNARIHRVDFKSQGIKKSDWALASLAVLAKLRVVVRPEMLQYALSIKFKDKALRSSLALVERVVVGQWT
jgi:pyruvate/2-oxoacid:ferredoxin oxidoreductase beta subunit/Pyruvate/2-oxoacid:ferredoxin oxidoreductase gamma subunit